MDHVTRHAAGIKLEYLTAILQPVCHDLVMEIDESSRKAVATRLQPHLPALDQCFRAAWQRWIKWLKKLEGSPADVSARSRASVLYDFIVAEAVRAFLKEDGIRVRKERGFLVLRFQDRVALRFKKFRSRTLSVSANKTGQSELFNGQLLEFPSGSLKPMTHVVAGYLLDGLAMDIAMLAITCTCDGKPLWAPIEIVPESKAITTIHRETESNEAVVRSAEKTREDRQEDESSKS